jgi:hypothetical protein
MVGRLCVARYEYIQSAPTARENNEGITYRKRGDGGDLPSRSLSHHSVVSSVLISIRLHTVNPHHTQAKSEAQQSNDVDSANTNS